MPAHYLYALRFLFYCMKKIFFPFFLALVLSCNKAYLPAAVQYNQQPVTQNAVVDSTLLRSLRPYRDSVNKAMNSILATLAAPLTKAQPDGSLNRFMADAVLHGARKTFGPNVDAAFVNYGGVRLNDVPAGPITRGKIFELMPFDNVLIVQQVSGTVLQQFLDVLAARGGWPISGVTFKIEKEKATNIKVGSEDLNLQKTYSIAQSDYIVNGGDGILLFKDLPTQNKGYLLRDALLDYVTFFAAQNKSIAVTTENRITK